jgi:hypothetical protein
MPMASSTATSNPKTCSYQYNRPNHPVPPASCIHHHKLPPPNNRHQPTLSNSPTLASQGKSGLVHHIPRTSPPDGIERPKSFSEQKSTPLPSISGQWELWPLKSRHSVLYSLAQTRLISFGGCVRSWARRRIGTAPRSERDERSRLAAVRGLTVSDSLNNCNSSFQRYFHLLSVLIIGATDRDGNDIEFALAKKFIRFRCCMFILGSKETTHEFAMSEPRILPRCRKISSPTRTNAEYLTLQSDRPD